ncbi:MAG: DUF3466 family protein [Janthinobacterium lividum]
MDHYASSKAVHHKSPNYQHHNFDPISEAGPALNACCGLSRCIGLISRRAATKHFVLSVTCVLVTASAALAAPVTYTAPAAAGAYTITDLGTLGGSTSRAFSINSTGEVAGTSATSNGVQAQGHAFLWKPAVRNGTQGKMVDLSPQIQRVSGNPPGDELPMGQYARPIAGTQLPGVLVVPRLGIPNARMSLLRKLPQSTNNSDAYGISAGNCVVGTVRMVGGKPHAVLWRNGSKEDLGTLGGDQDSAYSVNDQGLVVGMSMVDSNCHHAFLWRSGKMHDLGTLVRDPDQAGQYLEDSTALAVNARGEVAGFSYTSSGHDADYHACLWIGRYILDLGTLGGRYSTARALNDVGEVVGQSLTSGILPERHAFWWHDGKMSDISPFSSKLSDALGINNRGQVVGLAELPDGDYHAFFYSKGQSQDLNNLLAAGSGWELQEAHSINNFGQIVGIGRVSGETHAFLLTPVLHEVK